MMIIKGLQYQPQIAVEKKFTNKEWSSLKKSH